jgi:hypothetical protein
MAEEKRPSRVVPIVVALIGLVGSLGGAWITTGAKFEKELESRGKEIAEMERKRQDMELRLAEAERRLGARLDQRKDEVEKVERQVAAAEQQQDALSRRIAEAEKVLRYAKELYDVKSLNDLRKLIERHSSEKSSAP